MIVVADTTPLNYLILIGEIDVLPYLFGQVLLPLAASEELQRPSTPRDVRKWMTRPPEWLEVRIVSSIVNPALKGLDPGEREAIQLALDLGLTTVLMDEFRGRKLAKSLHLEVQGTLGILERGAKIGKIDLPSALSKLERTSFRLSPTAMAAFLKRTL